MLQLLALATILGTEWFPPVDAIGSRYYLTITPSRAEDKSGLSHSRHHGGAGFPIQFTEFLPGRDPNADMNLPKKGNWTIAGTYLFMAVILCVVLYIIKPPSPPDPNEQRAIRLARINDARSVREAAEQAAPSPPLPAKEFIQIQDAEVASTDATAEELSGKWRGYYEQYGSSQRLCEFSLVFENGRVRGDGVDDVGAYRIRGFSSEGCRRLAFAKQYVHESEASNGEGNSEENLGHVVEYRGTAAGPGVTTSGLRGTWFIQTSEYTGQGAFHIWPVEGLHSASAMRASKEFLRKQPTFEISDDSVCVICFDRTIDVVLDPCGHIVVCAECARSLNPHRCPICRSEIQQILSATGTAMTEAGSSEEP